MTMETPILMILQGSCHVQLGVSGGMGALPRDDAASQNGAFLAATIAF